MSVEELLDRFPEIPRTLEREPLLTRYTAAFAEFLRRASKPSPCAASHDAANRSYLELVGPLAVYGYGLTSRERVLAQMQALLERQAADPEAFRARLLSEDGDGEPGSPGCS